jgi:hypothetical protein
LFSSLARALAAEFERVIKERVRGGIIAVLVGSMGVA